MMLSSIRLGHRSCGLAPVLVTLLTCLPAAGQSPEEMATPPGAASRESNVIGFTTTKRTVDSILGPARSGWMVNPLCRSMYLYGDNIKIIYLDGCVLSVTLPCNCATDAQSNPNPSVEANGRRVYFDPLVLRGIPIEGPIGEAKRDAEACFYMTQPLHTMGTHMPPRATNWWQPFAPMSRTRQF